MELYDEELRAKPALLAINKMDLPDAQNKLHELMNQLRNPKGKTDSSFHDSVMNTWFAPSDALSGKENWQLLLLKKVCLMTEPAPNETFT